MMKRAICGFLVALALCSVCRAQDDDDAYLRKKKRPGPSGCVTAAGHNYTTSFPLTENPISECNSWLNGQQSPASIWTNMRTTANTVAFGTEANNSGVANDSIAQIVGTWGNDQEIRGVVVAPTGGTADNDKELELELRSTMATNSITNYEFTGKSFQTTTSGCTLSIVRWNGTQGNATALGSDSGSTACLHTGDRFRVTAVGTTLSDYVNDILLTSLTDSGAGSLSSGKPGIGAFIAGAGTSNDFGLSSITATDTPIQYSVSGSSDVSTSGTTMTVTMSGATVTGDLLVCVGYWADTGRTISSAGDTTNGASAYTVVGTPTNGAGALSAYRSQMLYMPNITGFATTVHPTITLSGSAAAFDRGMACSSPHGRNVSGGTLVLDQSTAVKAGSGTTVTSNTTGTLAVAYEYVWGFTVFGSGDNPPAVNTSIWNERESINFGGNSLVDGVVTVTTALAMTWGQSPSSNYLAGILTFK